MSEAMPIEEYIAKGGVLSSPDNVPPRYRGELLRLMASFVDSELAGSAGFADTVNDAPGIQQRISAAHIVLEKTDHAGRVLRIMETFGADGARYAVHHPWADRVSRDSEVTAKRHGGDMRLSVFHYPVEGWIDAVVLNVLMGLATGVQLEELSGVSYQPLAEVFRAILPRERHHADLGLKGLRKIVTSEQGTAHAKRSVSYWHPRVAASFGHSNSSRFEIQSRFGLRHQPNEILLSRWNDVVTSQLASIGLN